jgi:hypothetical protein
MNDLVRYPFGTLSKSFYSGLPFGLFMSFPLPSRLIHIKDKKRRERKDKNTGGGERNPQLFLSPKRWEIEIWSLRY